MSAAGLDPEIVGREVLDASGQYLGRLESLYCDLDTGDVCFGAVAMLRRGRRRLVFVSLVDSTVNTTSVTLRCGAELARRAPQVRPGQPMPADLEAALYAHFDLAYRPRPAGGPRLRQAGG